MKIAICNQFWATAGGGESYAFAIAEALAQFGEVELLCEAGTDWNVVGDRLQVDVHRFVRRPVNFEDAARLAKVSAGYDLFVNTTYASALPSDAPKSLLVVHFPVRPERGDVTLRRLALRAAAKVGVLDRRISVNWMEGFGPWEPGNPGFRWTDDDAVLGIWLPPKVTKEVAISFGRDRPAPGEVRVVYEGTTVASTHIGPGQGGDVHFKVTGRDDGEPTRLHITCPGFRPADYNLSDDTRELGAQLTGLRIGGELVHRILGRLRPYEDVDPMRWLSTYDKIIVNSEFTKHWVKKWWNKDADVLYPAIRPRAMGDKSRIILSVGRFFPPERGHSKHQLEMVEAFRALLDGGVVGWELHLVGGCQKEDLPYLAQVRRAAEGLPVQIHVDLPGLLLADLYARASIYWHATGLSAKRSRPEAQEHFGIAVVEAMSAGDVPVVFDAAGPAEVVQHGRSGLTFADVPDLVRTTRALIDDPARLERLRAAALERSKDFRPEVMASTMRSIVESLRSS